MVPAIGKMIWKNTFGHSRDDTVMMTANFRYFLRYAGEYGFGNAVIFSLYKLFPRLFGLLHQKVNAGSHTVWAGMATVDPVICLDQVLDYKSWAAYGGATHPYSGKDNRTTFIWFVPDWSNVWGGGHYTLFRFANHFAKNNTRNIIFIYNNQRHRSPGQLQNDLKMALPDCQLEVIIDPAVLPSCAGAFATTWQSAYDVRAFEFAQQKFYFMQDYESLFY